MKWNILLGEQGAKRAREITARIEMFMHQMGGKPTDFCVGICRDPLLRCWTGRAVNLKDGNFVFSRADSAQMAQLIEQHFGEVVGTDIATISSTGEITYVYAYRKTWHTDYGDRVPLPA